MYEYEKISKKCVFCKNLYAFILFLVFLINWNKKYVWIRKNK